MTNFMRKTEIKKILLMAAIVVCGVCLFAKSFLVLHTYPEYKGDGVVLMFKLDPLEPDHVREDTFEADLVSPLRICRDEMKFVGQDMLEGIFALPLAVWLFLFLLPLAVWLKMRHPSLKKRWLAAGVVGLPLLVWVMWMFGIDVYDIPGKTHKIYDVVYDGMPEHLGDLYTDYLHDVYLSSRGIVPYGYHDSN